MFSAKTSAKSAGPEAPRPNGKPSGGKSAMPSIISAQLGVTGNLVSDGDIQIDGKVEGDVKTSRLTIGESGSVMGSVTAETLLISGAVSGQVRAKTVTLTRTARVQGDIWHDNIAIEAGAQFEGTCKRLNAANTAGQPMVTSGSVARRPLSGNGSGEVAGTAPNSPRV